jgi:hypothetical protein
MPRRRVRFRPPGLKPWTRVGTLGPFRGRLGLSWVIAAIIVGVVVLVAGWFALRRSLPPGASYVPIGVEGSFPEGSAHPAGAPAPPGTFVARVDGDLVAVVERDGCPLTVEGGGYRDCREARYDLRGAGVDGCGGLDLLPVRVYKTLVYVDPDHPAARSPAPPPGGSC